MADIKVPMALPQETPVAAPTKQISYDGDEETVPMFNYDDKIVHQIPKSQVEVALRTKRYVLPKGLDVPMVDPHTLEGGYFKSERVQEALDNGWMLEQPEDTNKRVVDAQYGDSEVVAGLAGAARGLSFGLSDQILTKTGLVQPKTLSGLEEANPVSSGVGEVGGFVAGLLGPTEAGLLVKGAEAAGKIAERSAAKYITKQALGAGASKTVAASIAEKMVPKILGSAVEGSFYGAGNLLSEEALGKADFNAENLLGSIGTGALIGGVAGGLFGAAEVVAPYAKTLAGKVSKPLTDAAEGLTNKSKAIGELTGMTKKEAMRAEQSKVMQDLPDFFKNELKMVKSSTDDELLVAIKSKMDESGEAISKISDTVDKVGNGSTGKVLAPESARVFDKIEKEIQENILSKLDGTVAGGDAIKQVAKTLDEYQNAFAGKDFLSAKEMLSEMRALDGKLQRFYRDPTTAKESIKALWEVRSVLRGEINALADRAASMPGIDPGLGQALRKANRDFHLASTVHTPLERKLLAKSGLSLKDMGYAGFGVSNGVTGMMAAAMGKFVDSDLRRRMVILSNVEKYNLDILKNITASTKNFFNKAGKIAEKEMLYKINDSALSHDLESGRKPSSRQQAFENVQNNLQKYSTDSGKLVDMLAQRTSGMDDVAPETSAALTNNAQNAILFLNSKVPRSSQKQGMFDLMQNKKMPSAYDLSKFERYLKAVENPKSVLKDFGKGKLTLEGTEALKVVYPNMYANLQSAVMEYISTNEDNVPYKDKIRLGILLDTPTDASLIPENVIALQGMFSSQEQQSPGYQVPASGAKNLNIAEREATATQDIQSEGAGG